MQDRIAYQGITFDDVLLEPAFSDVLPREVDVRTQLTRNIPLNLPIVSSPMEQGAPSPLRASRQSVTYSGRAGMRRRIRGEAPPPSRFSPGERVFTRFAT